MTEYESIRDKTLGEIFDELCVKLNENEMKYKEEQESVTALFKGKCPVTGKIRGMKIELMRT